MLEQSKLQKIIKTWSKDFDPNKVIRLDKKLIHKENEQNVCVSRIQRISEGDEDNFIIQVAVDITHPYFFEHYYDHIPGMLMLESGRQAGVAIAHLFYHIGYDTAFILNEMYARFEKYAETSKPLFILSTIRKKKYRKGVLFQMEHDGDFIQDNNKIGYMGGIWKMCDKKFIDRMRRAAN